MDVDASQSTNREEVVYVDEQQSACPCTFTDTHDFFQNKGLLATTRYHNLQTKLETYFGPNLGDSFPKSYSVTQALGNQSFVSVIPSMS
jgi:hypothetical protein